MFLTNATLYYEQKSNVPSSYNPITGEPVFGNGSTLTVTASLEEAESKTSVIEDFPGIDRHAVYLEGRAINPAILPSSLTQGVTMRIEYNDGSNIRQGHFYLLPVVKGRLGLESVFGQAIAGYLY